MPRTKPASLSVTTNHLAYRLLALGVLLVGGCFPYPIVLQEGGTDAGRDSAETAAETGPPVYEYTTEFFSPGGMVGFNFDGLNSDATDVGGCSKVDWPPLAQLGSTTPDEGIDNSFRFLKEALDTQMLPDLGNSWALLQSNSRVRFGLRLRNVDDFMRDDSIQVEFFVILPTFTSDCMRGRGKTWAEWDRGAMRPTRIMTDGRIANGIVNFDAGRSSVLWFPVTLTNGKLIDIPLRGIRMKFTVSTDQVIDGLFGARVNGAEFAGALQQSAMNQPGLTPTVASMLVTSVIDLRYMGLYCEAPVGSDVMTSGDISIGSPIQMNNAVFQASPVTAPISGTCYFQ